MEWWIQYNTFLEENLSNPWQMYMGCLILLLGVLIECFFEAVISSNRLKVHLPNTPDKLKVLADGFDAVSGARGYSMVLLVPLMMASCVQQKNRMMCQESEYDDSDNDSL